MKGMMRDKDSDFQTWAEQGNPCSKSPVKTAYLAKPHSHFTAAHFLFIIRVFLNTDWRSSQDEKGSNLRQGFHFEGQTTENQIRELQAVVPRQDAGSGAV